MCNQSMAKAKLKIQKVMKELGVTQYELAKRLKRPDRNVKRFLEPGADLKWSTLVEIAEALDVKVRVLIDE